MPGQPHQQYSSPLPSMHSGRGPNNPVHFEQSMSAKSVGPEMSTVTTQPPVVQEMSPISTQLDDWSDGSEYEVSNVDSKEWRKHSDWPEYEDSDVDWEEWRDHPQREFWQDWQDAWMSQDPGYLEQDIHSNETPISLLAKQKFRVEKMIETIYDHINMERQDLRSTLPELRNRGQRLLEEYMDSFTSLEARRSNYRAEP